MNPKMNFNERVRQVSRQLEISDTHDGIRLLPALEDMEPRLYSDRNFDFFLIPINADLKEEVERLDDLYVDISDFEIAGETKRYLRIRTSSNRRPIFTPFVAELGMKDLTDPAHALDETLAEWKEFWSGKSGELSPTRQRGLLGELSVLANLIEHGEQRLVELWGGPLDWVHDFESERLNIEVKTTMLQPPSVHISMIKQVAPMEGDGKELHLVVVGLENGDDTSLPTMVSDIREKLSRTDYLQNFEHVLRRSGYRDEHSTYYNRRYAISYNHSHQITDQSPVLNPAMLGEIPSTVVGIK